MPVPIVNREPRKVFTTVAADQVIGDVAVGTGADCQYAMHAEVEVVLGGTTPEWTITPLYINAGATAYNYGEPLIVSSTDGARQVFTLETCGCRDVNFLCNGSSGTSATVTITVTPVTGS